jgi:hypothetical protein
MSRDSEERLARYVRARAAVLVGNEERDTVHRLLDEGVLEPHVKEAFPISRDAEFEDFMAVWGLGRIYLEEWDTLPLTIVGT